MIANRLRRKNAREPTEVSNHLTAAGAGLTPILQGGGMTSESSAMKLSAVNRCVEVLSDKISILPSYITDRDVRGRVDDHNLMEVLNVRPNEAMTPTVRRKLLECQRMLTGNAYEWIIRNQRTGLVEELIPLPTQLVNQWVDSRGLIWYDVIHPITAVSYRLPSADILHYKGYSRDGYTGISVLRRANDVLTAATAAQAYDLAFYNNGGRPSGVLTVDADLSGKKEVTNPDGTTTTTSKKEWVRNEWNSIYGGASNSFRTAVLDFGVKYAPVAITNKDAQFVENKEVSIRDIARFFGVPLHFLFEGEQSYNSNEQNAIEFVSNTIQPIVTQYEEEQGYKLLFPRERKQGYELHLDMMVLLRADTASRGAWYKKMREIGVYSVNDICRLEDLPDVEGGDERYASLNYVPLGAWEALSKERAKTGGTSK